MLRVPEARADGWRGRFVLTGLGDVGRAGSQGCAQGYQRVVPAGLPEFGAMGGAGLQPCGEAAEGDGL